MELPEYRRFTESEFEDASDDDLLGGVVDWILRDRISWDAEARRDDLSRLSSQQAAIFHSWLIDMQVQNGGFNQYFFNTRGKHIGASLVAYELLEAPDHLALFREAVEKAGFVANAHVNAARQKSVTATLEAFSESYENNPLNELGSRYYRLVPEIDVFQAALIRRNPDDFALQEPN